MRNLVSLFTRLKRSGGFLVRQLLRRAPSASKATILEAQIKDGQIVLSGRIRSNYTVQSHALILRKFRKEEITQDFEMNVAASRGIPIMKWVTGLQWQTFTVHVDFNWQDLPASIYGLGYKCDEQVRHLTLSNDCVKVLSDDQISRTYCIFNDPAVNVPRIEMYHFGEQTLTALRHQASKPRPDKIACVVGEYSNTARDNGRALFEQLRINRPDIETAYIVEADNVDNYPIDQPNVFEFGSSEHLAFCIDAKVCAFTHHRGYVYPYILRLIAHERYQSTRALFLQHGIIALKRSIVVNYHYNRSPYDGFCVSSQGEKDIVVQHFGYPEAKVHVTGLPRLDQLLQKSFAADTKENQVLIFPTWRQGFDKKPSSMISHTAFVQNWQKALMLLSEAGVQTHFILHPILQRHAELFAPYVDKMSQAQDFQEVLSQSSALITDHSSVSFDALYLKKPVFLFQFIEDDGPPPEKGFVDFESQSPGQISQSPEALVDQVTQARSEQWEFSHRAQYEQYFSFHDGGNMNRVADVIVDFAKEI